MVLTAVLSEREPGALEAAWRELPRSAGRPTTAAAKRLTERLATAHPRASELLRRLLR